MRYVSYVAAVDEEVSVRQGGRAEEMSVRQGGRLI